MTFKIEWATGFVDIEIEVFFREANKNQVKKFLRLAKQYSDEKHRNDVLAVLDHEIETRTKALDCCGELAFKREQILRQFFEALPEQFLPPQERQLVKERDKLRWCKELISNERWGDCE